LKFLSLLFLFIIDLNLNERLTTKNIQTHTTKNKKKSHTRSKSFIIRLIELIEMKSNGIENLPSSFPS